MTSTAALTRRVPAPRGPSLDSELSAEIRAMGLWWRAHGCYWVKIIGGVAVLSALVAGLVQLGDKAVAFLAVQLAVFGLYMGASFAPNHQGMPVLAAGTSLDFVHRPVLMPRNVRGGWFMDTFLGGGRPPRRRL